jgi:hypothetical protein
VVVWAAGYTVVVNLCGPMALMLGHEWQHIYIYSSSEFMCLLKQRLDCVLFVWLLIGSPASWWWSFNWRIHRTYP